MRLAWPVASLRAYLVLLSLIAAVPTAVLMAVQAVQHGQAQALNLSHDLTRDAVLLSQAVDRELDASASALRVLGAPDARGPDEAFLAAVRAKPPPRPSWSALFVLDAQGRLLAQTTTAVGLPPPPGFAHDQAVVVSELVAAPAGRHFTAVLVPAADGRSWLGAWIDAQQWQRILEREARLPSGFVTLYDGARRVIAGTLQPGATGRVLPADAVEAPGERVPSVPRSVQLDGQAQYVAWQTVPGSAWGVGAGVPAAVLDRGLLRSVLTAIGAAALCLLLGVTLARWLARRITGPLEAIGAAQPLNPEPIAVREIAELRNALAAARIRESSVRLGLQRKADEFEAIFQGSPVGLAVAQDAQAESVTLNQALQDLLQSPPGAPVVWPLAHAGDHRLAPEDWPLQRAARSGQAVAPIELSFEVGGAPRHVLAQAAPLLGPGGMPRGAIGVVLDITEAKEARERLLAADRRLRDAQNLVDFAQRAGGIGFFHYGVDADELAGTAGYARLFGLGAEAPAERLDAWLARIDPADRELVAITVQRMLAGASEIASVVFRVAHGPGAPRWLSARLQARNDAAARRQLVGAVVDITEQQQAEQERTGLIERERSARREAEDANRAKDEFLALLSHELRNPLNGITTAAEVLHLLGGGDAQAAEARATITRQTQRLTRLLNTLLDTASVVSDRIQLVRAPVELGSIVAAAIAELLRVEPDADARIDLAGEPVWVDGDALRLEQVAAQLIGNALKYTPAEGRITVAVRADGEHAVLEVHDQGQGIAPDLLAHVFEPFVQGARPLDRSGGGLGLGLTLVRRLVQLHGGSVSAQSSAQGSVFRVLLPHAAAAAPAPRSTSEAHRRRPRSVLVVEDDADALHALRTALELDGHEVGTAADGTDGLRTLLERRPEIGVIDIGLPGLNGFELARLARGAGYAGHLIALSGYGQRNNVQQALRAGFDAHLNKPVDFPRLRELLASA